MNNFIQSLLLNTFMNQSRQNLTPTQQNYIDAIQNGDPTKGEQLAMNLCNSMGVSKEEAIYQARQYFHI